MRRLWSDARTHWPAALVFLAYWLAVWGMNAASSIAKRGELGGDMGTTTVVLACLVSPLFAGALAAWWRAPGVDAHGAWRGPIQSGMLAAVLVCEANLAVIFCESSDLVNAIHLQGKVWFDLFMAGMVFAATGVALGVISALAVLALRRFRMTAFSKRALFWAPRALSILFIAFVSMFALDVFGEGRGFWQTLAALTIHLIPTFVMVALLMAAWRWEWVGAVAFTGCGIVFMVIVRGPWWVKTIFAVPCLVMAWLFLINWRNRADLRVKT